MGQFNRIDLEIRAMIRRGYSLNDIYIYFKDYITIEDVARIYSEEQVWARVPLQSHPASVNMKLQTAMNQLLKEVDFLGYKNLGELLQDLEKYPLSFPLRTIEAYKTYKELAYV